MHVHEVPLLEIETSIEKDIDCGQHIHILPGGQATGPATDEPGHRHVLPGGTVTRCDIELDIEELADQEFEEQETDSIVIRK